MRRPPRSVAPQPTAVEQAILRRVEEQAGEWFPAVGTTPTVRLRRLVERPRAALYAVYIGEETSAPRALAKVRRGWTAGPGGAFAGTRPRLVSTALSASEMTALEYSGLTRIHSMFAPSDPDFSTVRPLAHLAEEDTLLLEYVDAATLRQVLVQGSRVSPRRIVSGRPGSARVWGHVGEWLSVFQREMPRDGLPARQVTRDDVADRLRAFAEFLTARLGARTVGTVAQRAPELAEVVLPRRLPLAVGHGDYAPRNMFVGGDGRLAVFDPLPRWAVPRYEDLSRFLVSTRLLGLQVATRGAAFSQADLDEIEHSVIEGYGRAAELRLPELRCYQLLITLDSWSALVDNRPGGWRGRLKASAIHLAAGYLRAETERLLRLAQDQV